MRPFLQERKLYITPLAPIHIGAGQEINPTEYVVQDNFLYGFNPADGALSDAQKKELSTLARRADLLAIQRFIKKHAERFVPFAQFITAACPGFKREYENNLGVVRQRAESGEGIFNQFFVSRHINTGLDYRPYIPGSSFKGAVRTAWLDHVYTEAAQQNPRWKRSTVDRRENLERELGLDLQFARSPLRLFKVADFMPDKDLFTEVLYSVVWYRKKTPGKSQNSGLKNRLECLVMGQYRGLSATVSLPEIPQDRARLAVDRSRRSQAPDPRYLSRAGGVDFAQLVDLCNSFYGRLLLEELEFLESHEGNGQQAWCDSVRNLLFGADSELRKKIAEGQAFVVRLGASIGRDSLTFNDWLRDRIDIKFKAPDEMQALRDTPKTKTLAAEYGDAEGGFLPFGWAVVEIDPAGDCAPLQQWCEQGTGVGGKINQLRQQLQQQRQQFKEWRGALKALVKQEEQEAQQARIEDEKKLQAETDRLAAMSENERKIEVIRKACEDWAAQLPPHGNFRKQNANPGEEGIYQDASRLVKEALAEESWTAEDRALLAETIEEWLPQAVGPWDARGERRRLKLNRLRGQ